jgi:hypothetical protein
MANIDEHVVPVTPSFASCVFHPDVQMRQKTALGGWEVLRPHCPRCYPPAFKLCDSDEFRPCKRELFAHGSNSASS